MNDITDLRINEILHERGMTKVELAKAMGTTKENLNGKLKSPSFPTLVAIADALGVTLRDLFVDRSDSATKETETTHACPHCGKPISIKTIVK